MRNKNEFSGDSVRFDAISKEDWGVFYRVDSILLVVCIFFTCVDHFVPKNVSWSFCGDYLFMCIKGPLALPPPHSLRYH